MSLRSPLGRVLGLGSARGGSGHWYAQRVTAVALVLLGAVVRRRRSPSLGGATHEQRRRLAALAGVSSALARAAGASSLPGTRCSACRSWSRITSATRARASLVLLVIKFAFVVAAVVGVLAVLRIAFGVAA